MKNMYDIRKTTKWNNYLQNYIIGLDIVIVLKQII